MAPFNASEGGYGDVGNENDENNVGDENDENDVGDENDENDDEDEYEDGYENEDEEDEEDEDNEKRDNKICRLITATFGQSSEDIDPYEVWNFIDYNGYEDLSFRAARNLDEQYAYWSCVPIDEAEGGTHWLAEFDFPKVGDTIEIYEATWKVSWTGVLTFKVVEI